MVKTEDILAAHYDCVKGKPHSRDAIQFEVELFKNVTELADQINTRTYKPTTAISFVVTKPVCREVFAADYRDRVVHHYICIRLEPLLEKTLNDRTYNCRKGKGQLAAVKQLREDIKECTHNYTRDAWYLQGDMKSFFMSIPKERLANSLDAFIIENYDGEDKEDLRYVMRETIMHDPTTNCRYLSSKEEQESVPVGKSLRTAKKGCGIPIGNQTSQHAANFWLNTFDWMIERELGFIYHGRYADDFYIVSEDKEKLMRSIQTIRKYLHGIGITLHPGKIKIQEARKGIKFAGMAVKRGRMYIGNRTVGNMTALVMRINRNEGQYTIDDIERYVCSLNSYLGLMKHCDSYVIRRKLLGGLNMDFYRYVYIRGHFECVRIKKRYKREKMMIKRLRNKNNIEKVINGRD